MSALPNPFYTPEQYVEMEEKAEVKSEYVSGQIFAMSGGTPKHSAIGSNLVGELRSRLRGTPFQTYNSDLRVTVMQASLMTYPDATVVCGEQHFHPLDTDRLINPTVLIEVLSPSTEANDRGEKWAKYQRLDSLRDYVLVSQKEARVEQYVRQEDGSWRFTTAVGREASIFLPSLDCTVPLADV